jgi:HEAT repeat protein
MPTPRERLEFALKLLAKRDERERHSGAAELVELAHEPEISRELRPKILELLADANPQLRAAAVRALPALGPAPDLVPRLETAAHDSEAVVRREALRSLAGLEDRSALPALAGALGDADGQVQFEAAIGLASLGDASGADVLLAAIDDKVRRFFALGALAQLGEVRAREPAERILHRRIFISEFERAQAAGLLAKLGVEEGRAYLLSRIGKRRAEERGLAMELCGQHQIAEAIPKLRQALAEKGELFRGTAARSLGLLRDPDSGPALIALARDPKEDLDTRCDAMEGLMYLRTPEAVAALHTLSSSGESEAVRSAANDALGWLQRHGESQR